MFLWRRAAEVLERLELMRGSVRLGEVAEVSTRRGKTSERIHLKLSLRREGAESVSSKFEFKKKEIDFFFF